MFPASREQTLILLRFLLGWRSLILSMFFVFTAMLCKEQGITATAVCVLYEIFVVQKVNVYSNA